MFSYGPKIIKQYASNNKSSAFTQSQSLALSDKTTNYINLFTSNNKTNNTQHYQSKNHQNSLIQQIQGYASQIFRSHATSGASVTQALEMSLELSSESQHDIYQIQQENNLDSNVFGFIQMSRGKLKFQNQQQKQIRIRQTLQKQRHEQYKNIDKNKNFKIEGQSMQKPEKSISLIADMLKRSQIISKNNNKRENKPKSLIQKFSNYSSSYLSPYSSKKLKQNSNSYMQKSTSKKRKQSNQFKYIQQKINENVQPHISFRKIKNKQSKSKSKSKKKQLTHVKAKYRQIRPLLHQYQPYMNQNIYKKVKNQLGYYQQKRKIYSSRSPQQIQYRWNNFLEKQNNFLQDKKQRLITKQLQNMQKDHIIDKLSPLKTKNQNISKDSSIHVTTQDYIKKIKRQKEKLKDKLSENQISNYIKRSYEDQKRFGREIFNDVYGIKPSIKSSQDQISRVQQFSTIKDSLIMEINNISKFKSRSNESLMFPHNQLNQNSFQSAHKKRNKKMNVYSNKSKDFIQIKQAQNNQQEEQNTPSTRRQNISSSKNKMSKSSIIALTPLQKNDYTKNVSKNNYTDRILKKQQLSKRKSLSPAFKKKGNIIFSEVNQNLSTLFLQQNSLIHTFNANPQQIIKQALRQRQKELNESKANRKNKITQLINPKYFKTISQLQEYSSSNRQKSQKKSYNFSSSSQSQSIQNKNRSRNVIKQFDPLLMKKTIQDIQRMKRQKSEENKRIKFRVQDYNNISNLVKGKQTNNYIMNNQMNMVSESDDSQSISVYKHQTRQKSKNINRHKQRSVSPIGQQDSISNLSVSMLRNNQKCLIPNPSNSRVNQDSSICHEQDNSLINNQRQNQKSSQSIIKLQKSQVNDKFGINSYIVVKDKKQIQFLFANK